MTPVTFCKLEDVKFGERFVIDMDNIGDDVMHLEFLSWNYAGNAMVTSGPDFVRGFETGLTRKTDVIKIGH